MLEKIPFNSCLWKELDEQLDAALSTQELLQLFAEEPDLEGEVFLELHDRIFDSNTCLPQFYLALPYLIETACKGERETASELWAYIGGWLGEGARLYSDIPDKARKLYEDWINYGVAKSLEFIVQNDLSGLKSLSYLLGAPLGMTNPVFGYASTSNIKFDIGCDTDLLITCPHGHMHSYILRDNEIVNSLGKKGRDCLNSVLEDRIEGLPVMENNPWKLLNNRLIDCQTGQNRYFTAAQELCRKGVSKDTPVPLTLVLYGCLLECFGRHEAGNHETALRCFHMTDQVICPECGISFSLADGWREYDWLLKQ